MAGGFLNTESDISSGKGHSIFPFGIIVIRRTGVQLQHCHKRLQEVRMTMPFVEMPGFDKLNHLFWSVLDREAGL